MILSDKSKGYLEQVGIQVRTARLRRNMTIEQVAKKAGISAVTVLNIEKGLPSVSLGKLMLVLQVLDLEGTVAFVAGDDAEGRELQDGELRKRARPAKKQSKKPAARVKKVSVKTKRKP